MHHISWIFELFTYDINGDLNNKKPSGISAAMTAISASIHKQYLTVLGYSALHNSDKCLPEKLNKAKL